MINRQQFHARHLWGFDPKLSSRVLPQAEARGLDFFIIPLYGFLNERLILAFICFSVLGHRSARGSAIASGR
jgi:hypothetical protein